MSRKFISIVIICAILFLIMPFSTFAQDKAEGETVLPCGSDTAETGYYLVGSMTGWKPDPSYQLNRSENSGSIEEYTLSTSLSENEKFKVVCAADGKTISDWYPDGVGNDLSVTHTGFYTVRFRPNGDGEEDWIKMSDPSKRVISISPAAYPGYHIIGDMTDWKISPNSFMFGLRKNDESTTEEYVSVVFQFKKGDQFKIVSTSDGVAINGYYPDGIDNNVTIEEDGFYSIFFRPAGDGEENWIPMASDPSKKVINVKFEYPVDQTPTELPTEAGTEEPEALYKEKFDQYIAHYMAQTLYYNEEFYHKDQNGDTDWALISAYSNAVQPIGIFYIIGNRAIKGDNAYVPFDFGCGIYDVKKDQFFDITQVNLDDYDGLEEVFNGTKFGKLIGDIDKDNQITILDATGIQKCLASINPFPEDDFINAPEGSPIMYYSDYDRDGQRTVLDATHIQKHLAGIE
jgi:hypothetical protein